MKYWAYDDSSLSNERNMLVQNRKKILRTGSTLWRKIPSNILFSHWKFKCIIKATTLESESLSKGHSSVLVVMSLVTVTREKRGLGQRCQDDF